MSSNNKTAIPSVHGTAYRQAIEAQYLTYYTRHDPDLGRAEQLMALFGYTDTDLAQFRLKANIKNVDVDKATLEADMKQWAKKHDVAVQEEIEVKIIDPIDDCTVPNVDTHNH